MWILLLCMFATKHTAMKSLYSALVSLVVLSGCAADNMVDVVPQPMKVRVKSGTFNPVGAPVRYSPEFRGDAESAVVKFADRLSNASGTPSAVSMLAESVSHEGFVFVYDSALGAEEYRLRIDRRSATVHASSLSGVLYSIATLSQMMPAAYFGKAADAEAFWQLPCCEIQDRPRFAWRGMHLDVARHFFSVEEVKRYLDIMVLYKMNRFHWHLSDDQGWRVEIRKYPRLTSVGSVRAETMLGRIDYDEQPLTYDGTPYGGFYTQEEIREVVAYASSLGITVVPEIDLPGHMLSALAAYPELGCRGGAYKVWGRWGISKDVLCVGKETTFDFIEGGDGRDYGNVSGDIHPYRRRRMPQDCMEDMSQMPGAYPFARYQLGRSAYSRTVAPELCHRTGAEVSCGAWQAHYRMG